MDAYPPTAADYAQSAADAALKKGKSIENRLDAIEAKIAENLDLAQWGNAMEGFNFEHKYDFNRYVGGRNEPVTAEEIAQLAGYDTACRLALVLYKKGAISAEEFSSVTAAYRFDIDVSDDWLKDFMRDRDSKSNDVQRRNVPSNFG